MNMNRDSRGRFVKNNDDNVLIKKMNLNINNNSREIPVEDNRKSTTLKSIKEPVYKIGKLPLCNVDNIDNIDKELVNRAIKNINKLRLGSIEHPAKVDDFFKKFNCECSKEKKPESDLLKTFSKNANQNDKKIRHHGFGSSRCISLLGNNVGNFSTSIVEDLKDFVVSFNDSIKVSINIKASAFPNIISLLRELKRYDYFTIVFKTYDIHGFSDKIETFDGFKLFDLTYVGEKDVYKITLTKDNI